MTNPFDLSLRHLDATLAVIQYGSISGASAAVNLSQPALTQALSKLERLLGQRLFDRRPNGATPSAAGAILLPRIGRGIEFLVEGGRRLRRAGRLPQIAHLQRLVTLGQCEALTVVERAGSYALAARQLGLSQPSVHRAVKELEAILGMVLLDRAGRAMRSTPAGARFCAAIRLMATEFQAGIDELAALDQGGLGTIRIGSLPLPRAGLLPEALASFSREHPRSRITVIEGPYAELLGALRGGEIDMLVGALREPTPTHDVVQQPLFADDLYVIARTGHPLAGPADAGLETMARYPWVIGATGAPMRAFWESLFASGPQPTMRIECGSVLTTRGLLLEGDWLALMSIDQFRLEQQTGLLTTVGAAVPGSRRQIGITTRRDWIPTAPQDAFREALRVAGTVRSSAI